MHETLQSGGNPPTGQREKCMLSGLSGAQSRIEIKAVGAW